MGILHDQLLVLTDDIADAGQDAAPDAGPQQGVERKAEVVHAGHPGRDRDQVPYHRQQAADEGGNLAMAQKEALHSLKLVRRDQHIFAVFYDQRPTQIVGDEVVDVGAGQATQGAAQDRAGHVHLPLKGQIAGRRHDQLARHRDDRAFHGHQQKNAGIPHGADCIQQPLNKCVH